MDYYCIKEFDATGIVKTVFTSKGRGCWLSNTEEGHAGYREVLSHFNLSENDIASTFQRHSDCVRAVTRKDAGINTFWRSDPIEVADGIVTNETGFLLTSMESDCTPVYILDPVQRAVGMVHSGWRGTASLISVRAVELMRREYGSRPEDIMIAFGPCICKDCYEVGGDLIAPFSVHFKIGIGNEGAVLLLFPSVPVFVPNKCNLTICLHGLDFIGSVRHGRFHRSAVIGRCQRAG